MDEIKEFFDKFAIDFSEFSGELIASRYAVPYSVIDSSGNTKYLHDKAQIANHFQSYLNDYKSQGVVSCGYELSDHIKTGEFTWLAVISWFLSDDSGEQVLSWRESYNLIRQKDGLFIYSSSDFK